MPRSAKRMIPSDRVSDASARGTAMATAPHIEGARQKRYTASRASTTRKQ
jgi:hypothetical protein